MTTTPPTTPTSLEKLQGVVAQDIAIETQAVTLILEIPGLITAAKGSANPDAALDALATQLDTAGKSLQAALTGSGSTLTITSANIPDATVGAGYTGGVAFTGGELPVTFSLTGLPADLIADSAGNISGTATAAPGTYRVSVVASDSGSPPQTVTGMLFINVVAMAT